MSTDVLCPDCKTPVTVTSNDPDEMVVCPNCDVAFELKSIAKPARAPAKAAAQPRPAPAAVKPPPPKAAAPKPAPAPKKPALPTARGSKIESEEDDLLPVLEEDVDELQPVEEDEDDFDEKPRARSRSRNDEDDDEDDFDDQPRSRGSSSRLILCLILFLASLGGGAAGAYFGLRNYFNPASSAPSSNSGETKAAASQADDLMYLPNNCQVLAYVAVPKLFASETYSTLKKNNAGLDSSDEEQFKSFVGMAPEEVERITAGLAVTGNNLPKDLEWTVVIRSKSNVNLDAMKSAAGESDAKPKTVGKHTIYPAKFGSAYFKPDERTLVFGANPEMLESIITREKPAKLGDGLKAAYKPLNESWSLWLGIDAEIATKALMLLGPGGDMGMIKKVDAFVIESPGEKPLDFQIVVKCKDESSADQIRNMLTAQLAGMVQQGVGGDMLGKYAGTKFEKSGTSVAAKIVFDPEPYLKPLIEKKAEQKWDNPPYWIEMLKDDAEQNVTRAINNLRDHPEQSIPLLIRALEADKKTRSGTLRVLREMGDKGRPAAPAVAKLLKQPLVNDRLEALIVLEAFGPEAQKDVLAALNDCKLEDADDGIKNRAETMVSKLGPPDPEIAAKNAAKFASLAGDNNADVNVRLKAVKSLAFPENNSPGRMQAVLKALTAKDSVLRAAAAVTLGKIGLPEREKSYEMLVTTLKDPETDVCLAAAASLDGFGVPSDKECALLLDMFKAANSSPTAQAAAVRLLAKGGPAAGKNAFFVLLPGLSHNDPGVRTACGAALDAVPPPDVAELPTLIQPLSDDKANPEIKRVVLKTLNKFGKLDRAKVPTLSGTLMKLIETDAALADASLQALTALGDPAETDVPALMRLMQNTSVAPTTRGYAASVLAPRSASSPEIAKVLLAGLEDKDAGIRRLSSEGLIKAGLKTPAAAQAFAKALADRDPAIRLNVTTALVAMPPEALTYPHLLLAYADEDQAVALKAIEGLKRVVTLGKLEMEALAAALKSSDLGTRLYAISVLAEQKEGVPLGKAALESLITAVGRDENATIRLLAINTLIVSGADPKDITPTLIAKLDKKNETSVPVRGAALAALVKLKQEPKVVLAMLLEAASDKASPLNPQAIAILSKLGDYGTPVLPQLMDSLKNDATREVALLALTGIGKDAVKGLAAALESEKVPATQILLLDTLAKIGPDAKSALRQVQAKRGNQYTPDVQAAAKKASDALQAKPK